MANFHDTLNLILFGRPPKEGEYSRRGIDWINVSGLIIGGAGVLVAYLAAFGEISPKGYAGVAFGFFWLIISDRVANELSRKLEISNINDNFERHLHQLKSIINKRDEREATDFAEILENMSGLEKKVKEIRDEVIEVDKRVGDIGGNVLEVEANVEKIDGNVIGVNKRVQDIDGHFRDMYERVKDYTWVYQIGSIDQAICHIEGRLNTATQVFNTFVTDNDRTANYGREKAQSLRQRIIEFACSDGKEWTDIMRHNSREIELMRRAFSAQKRRSATSGYKRCILNSSTPVMNFTVIRGENLQEVIFGGKFQDREERAFCSEIPGIVAAFMDYFDLLEKECGGECERY